MYTGTELKGKWKKTHVVLQSGKGVFTSLLFYKKPSRFIAKLAPLGKHDLDTGFDVSLGSVLKGNRYVIDLLTHGDHQANIRLSADSEELRSIWIHELITKRAVNPLSSDCKFICVLYVRMEIIRCILGLKWFVVRIKETVATNRLKLSGKCTLCVYRDRIVLATGEGVMLGEFPLHLIKSYECLDDFHLSMSAGSMYGEITLLIVTDQKRELFEKIHRLKMHSIGRDSELPPYSPNLKFVPKHTPDDNMIQAPSRRPSKRNDRGRLQDSASETDILAAVNACFKPNKPPLPRDLWSVMRTQSNASAFMKPRRIDSPSFLNDSGEKSPIASVRRPSEPKLLHRDRQISAQFHRDDSFLVSPKTHCQFTTPDMYDHAIFKPRPNIGSITESIATESASITQYDSIPQQRRKKVNIYESLSFGRGDNHNNNFIKPRDPNDIPDIPVNSPNPPLSAKTSEATDQSDFVLTSSISAPQNIADLSNSSISSHTPSVFTTCATPPPPPPILPHGDKSVPQEATYYSDLLKQRGEGEFIKPTSSLKGLHSFKRASLSNHYETINFGFHTLDSGRRKAVRRAKLGKAKSEMPPDMLVQSQSNTNTLTVEKKSERTSSFNLANKNPWEVN